MKSDYSVLNKDTLILNSFSPSIINKIYMFERLTNFLYNGKFHVVPLEVIAPRKMTKNPNVAGEYSNPNVGVMLDTMLRATDTIKSWTQVFNILERGIINCFEDSVEEEGDTYTAKIRHISKLELHKIAVRLRLMPYNDMISWALEHVDIQTRSIINH
jgi:hypothetical protein